MKQELEKAAKKYAAGEITKSRVERAETAFKAGVEWCRKYLVDSLHHEANEQPENGRIVLALRELHCPVICGADNNKWEDCVKDYGITTWFYVDDLFPSTFYDIIKAKWDEKAKGKCYISLPISGHDLEDVKQRAETGKKKVEELGYTPVSPLDINKNPKAPYPELMGNCIAAILKCDAVMFLRGWEESSGCLLEHSASNIYGKETFFEATDKGE